MLLRPPKSTRTYTPFPHTTLFQSHRGRPVMSFATLRANLTGASAPFLRPAPSRADGVAQHAGAGGEGGCRHRLGEEVDGRLHAAPAVADTKGAESCLRSEARRVGTACVSTCRSRWSP